MRHLHALSFAGLLFAAVSAHAADFRVGDLLVTQPYARATVPKQPSGGVYLGIENTGKQADRLIGVATSAAKTTEIHNMTMDGNVMKMRAVDAIEIAPSSKLQMKPGNGYHIMLMGLNSQLKSNDKFTLTLTFEKAGKIEVPVQVDGATSAMQHQH